MRFALYVVMGLSLLTACSKDETRRDGSHGSTDPSNPLPDDSYSLSADELANDRPRIVSEALSLEYGNPGVMAISGDESSRDFEIRSVDNGHFARLRSDGAVGGGILNAALEIDNAPVELAGVAVAKQDGDTRWVVLETLAGEHIIMVISDMR